MNKYIKPAFMLTSLSSGTFNSANCSIKGEDRELIESVLDIPNAFAATEKECEDFPIDMGTFLESYCKFTSTDLGATQAFFS